MGKAGTTNSPVRIFATSKQNNYCQKSRKYAKKWPNKRHEQIYQNQRACHPDIDFCTGLILAIELVTILSPSFTAATVAILSYLLPITFNVKSSLLYVLINSTF
jgi:hypothetical protein